MSVPLAEQAGRAAHAVREGGVVAYPTEHCYGLGCNPRNPAAVRRVLELKHRSEAKGLILIGSGVHQLRPFMADLPEDLLARMETSWPAALTWLVPAAPGVPRWLRGNSERIALRVPDHALARRLCRECGHALVSTSANRSGQRPRRTAARVRADFADAIDYLVVADCGDAEAPSTIVDLVSGRVVR